MLDQKLHHWRQGPVEGALEHPAKLSPLGIQFANTGFEELKVSDLLDFQKSLFDHAVHRGLDRAVGQFLTFRQRLLDRARRTRFHFPDDLHDLPFGLR